MIKNTKIVCTLGPSCDSVQIIEKMVKAGMNVVRINFSHGNYAQFAQIIKNIRIVSKKLNTPIAIMQDLQGPKIRIGEMPSEGIKIKKGEKLVLSTRNFMGTEGEFPVQYQNLPNDVQKKDRILIDDGLLELEVNNVKGTEITCTVINGGIVKSHKGINVPSASISANPITTKDKKDLEFGIAQGVDFVALSFVKSEENIEELRAMIKKQKGTAQIIAKIERHEAVTNMEKIVMASDAIMVARGDLGVEMPAEQVPLIQKRLIHMANRHGKPVITATQMLQSMVTNPRPTRAEISDAANAIFDHSDALMLSNETAVGLFPVEAVETLAKVAGSVENELKKHTEFLPELNRENILNISYATCQNATKLAQGIAAKFIIAVTHSGFTAQHVVKHRCYVPTIVMTDDAQVQRQLALSWGINHVFMVKNLEDGTHSKKIRNLLIKEKLVTSGDKVVIVSNASKDEKTILTIKI